MEYATCMVCIITERIVLHRSCNNGTVVSDAELSLTRLLSSESEKGGTFN